MKSKSLILLISTMQIAMASHVLAATGGGTIVGGGGDAVALEFVSVGQTFCPCPPRILGHHAG